MRGVAVPDPEDTAWEGAVTYDTSALSDITTVGETSRIAAAPKRETLRTQQQRLETLDAVSVRYKGTRTTRQALRSDDELRKPPLKSKKRNHKEKDSDDEEEEESDSMELDQDGEEEEDVESEDEMMDDDEDDEDDQDDEEFDGDFDGDEEEQDMMDEVDSDDLDEDDEEGDEGKENSESGSEEGAGAARVALTRAVAARSVAATVARARRTQEQHALYEAALQLRLVRPASHLLSFATHRSFPRRCSSLSPCHGNSPPRLHPLLLRLRFRARCQICCQTSRSSRPRCRCRSRAPTLRRHAP